MIEIEINGELAQVPDNLNVAGLLVHLGIDGGRVAVELNREIVRQAEWESQKIEPGARLAIVHFGGGG